MPTPSSDSYTCTVKKKNPSHLNEAPLYKLPYVLSVGLSKPVLVHFIVTVTCWIVCVPPRSSSWGRRQLSCPQFLILFTLSQGHILFVEYLT